MVKLKLFSACFDISLNILGCGLGEGQRIVDGFPVPASGRSSSSGRSIDIGSVMLDKETEEG